MSNQNKNIIQYDKWDSHLILLVKGHYPSEQPFLELLKKYWCFRCGLTECGNDAYEYIADRMFKIIIHSQQYSHEKIQLEIHRELSKTYSDYYKILTTIEQIITVYKSLIYNITIKDSNLKEVINLSEPNNEIFSKVFNGDYDFNLYNEV